MALQIARNIAQSGQANVWDVVLKDGFVYASDTAFGLFVLHFDGDNPERALAWLAGVAPEWAAFHEGETLRRVSQIPALDWVPGFPMLERLNAATAGCLLALMAVWEYASPGGNPRIGILRFETTRGDRLFVGLLSAAYVPGIGFFADGNGRTGRAILKLTQADYAEHHLSALVARHGASHRAPAAGCAR